MLDIKEIEATATASCHGIKEVFSLLHDNRTKVAARESMDKIAEAIKVLAEMVDESGIEDKMLDHPDFISRKQLERETNYCSTELYGEIYVKVQDLYDLFPLQEG